MLSLLRTPRYIWTVAFRRTFTLNRNLSRNNSHFFPTAVRNARTLQTSYHSFNEVKAVPTENSLPSAESSKSPSSQLQQELYKLDADVRRVGRLTQVDVDKVFTSMKRIGRVSSTDGLLLIRCCGSLMPEVHAEQRTELLNDIWNTLPLLGCTYDVSHYNALLRVYLENEHNFDPVAFLTTMEQQRVEPNRVTYQRLLAQFCQNGDIEGASRILEFMKLRDLPLNEIIFNELITGHAKAKNMQDAKKTLEVMRNAQLSPNSSTYASLACGYAFLGDIENVLETMKEAETNNASLRDRDILNIIYTLTVNNHGHLIQQLIPKLRYTSGYNQECTKTVLELVNRGYHEIGFALLNTAAKGFMEDGSVAPTGLYFIKQIVKEGLPAEVVLEYCKKLQVDGHNNFGLLKAIETAFICQKTDDAIAFLKELASQKYELCPHFFWPVLVHKKGDDKAMYSILKLMLDLGCPANFDTFTDYFFPYVNTSDPLAVVTKLKDIGLEVNDVVTPLCIHMLLKSETKIAANILKKFPVKVNPALMASRCLASAYLKSKDISSTIQIMKHSKENPEIFSQRVIDTDVYGKFLVELIGDKDFQISDFEAIVTEMKKEDMKMSHSAMDTLYRHLGTMSNQNLISILKSMTSIDVPPLNGSNFQSVQKLPVDMSVEDLEAYLIMRKSKNLRTTEVLHKLLMLHAKLRNLKRVLELLQELDDIGFVFRANSFAVLLELFCYHEDLDRAMHYKRLIDTQFPEFQIDDHKIINLARLLVINKKYNDAEDMIMQHHAKFGVRGDNKPLQGNIFRLLDAYANSDEIGRARKVFEMLHNFGYCKAGNVLLGPLVKDFFLRNDLQGAIEEFLRIVKTYKVTPWKTELFKQLIMLQDSENLQTIIDASITVHGEANVMFDLAQAFIDCGQLQKAQKVIETPGLRARMDRIEAICEMYVEEKKISELEAFVQITKNVFGLNRDRMYYQLLRAYVNAENVEKALGTWVMMQEENIHPSNQTLQLLGTFLQRMNQPVPFEIPSTSYSPIERYEMAKKTGNMEEDSTNKTRNQGEMFLKSLESHLWRHKKKFPVKGLFLFIKDNPQSLNRVIKMADMYYQEGFCQPRNTVWMYLMTEKRFDEADKILEATPEMNRTLLFRDVCNHVRENNDIKISQKLLDVTNESNITNRNKGIAFSTHINVLVSLDKLEEALETLDEAQKMIDIEDLNKGSLLRLKEHLINANMTVPVTISEITSDRHKDSPSPSETS